MFKKIAFLNILFLIIISSNVLAQNILLYGKITDTLGNPQNMVQINVDKTQNITLSDDDGYYELSIPQNKTSKINYSFTGYKTYTIRIIPQPSEERIERNIIIISDDHIISEIKIFGQNTNLGTEKINVKHLTVLPDISGNSVEGLVKTMMGVSSNNELSSQYNVRGGNFDENLIYINDIQIYRPFLVRSGQQEGLSFINPNLVSDINFSAGGFDAKYGDKMSSVLDISYKKPKEFAASISGSLLGGTAHIEGLSKNKKFSHISGVRYKQSQYFLNTLEVEGDYKPVFADFQTFMTYQIAPKFDIEFLGNVAQNTYIFTPTKSEQTFGTFQEAYGLTIYYEGIEKDQYNSYFGAFSTKYRPNTNVILKLTASAFHTQEQETYDINGAYSLNQLDNDLGSDNFTDSILNLGIGQFHEHARNYLDATILSISHNGYWKKDNNYLVWGAKYQQELINDKIKEWEMVDSAGYSINRDFNYPSEVVVLDKSVSASNSMQTQRFSAFVQNTYTSNNEKIKLTGGIRASYWNYNKDFIISPRASIQYFPDWIADIQFRLASGIYYQSPFYREIRDFDGSLIADSKAQRSIHFVLGGYYNFKIWSRPFQYSAEIYYKKLDDLIPYELDNVRISYYANQRANGYAVGFDSKIFGEFVPGVDSWISLSIMQTKEDIVGDYYYEYYKDTLRLYTSYQATDSVLVKPGFIPRPSDQLISVGMFFQDYVPGNKNFKASLGFYFGTPIPYGPPQTERWRATYRSYPYYMRADLGLSLLLKSESKKYNSNFLNSFKTIWLSFEAFNILNIRNTINYSWVRIVPNSSNPNPFNYSQVAVANHLTGRLVNLKLTCNF